LCRECLSPIIGNCVANCHTAWEYARSAPWAAEFAAQVGAPITTTTKWRGASSGATRTGVDHREPSQIVARCNRDRPSAALGGRTPNKVHARRFPTSGRPKFEPRNRWRCRTTTHLHDSPIDTSWGSIIPPFGSIVPLDHDSRCEAVAGNHLPCRSKTPASRQRSCMCLGVDTQ
jgi:hypothetical protein